MAKLSLVEPSAQARDARRLAFCHQFVREHHPGMAGELVPLRPVRRPSDFKRDWWYQTDDSISALGGVYIGFLFQRYDLLDHDWRIGPREEEPWALVSEPYRTADRVPKLREELEAVGCELLEYPAELATHNPDDSLVLVANIVDHQRLAAAIAHLIIDAYEPHRRYPRAAD